MLWILLACMRGAPEVQDTVVQDSAGPPPDAVVDVVVVGSGPAGLSAAWAAQAAGAEVLVLELADTVGPTASYGQNFLLVDTQAQRDAGVQDGPETLAAEWSEFTQGGDGQDPQVQAFIAGLAELQTWFLSLGAVFDGPRGDPSAGATPRLHGVRIDGLLPAEKLAVDLAEWVWTGTRATELVMDRDQVLGVRFEQGARQGWVQAGATVLATGGFARDLPAVRAQRPEVAGLELLYETHPLSTGAGRPLLEAAGAQIQNGAAIGIYVHAMADPREGLEQEALLVPMLPLGLIVDASGQRLGNEDMVWGLGMDQVLLQAEGQRIWVLLPEEEWATMEVVVPGYNSAEAREVLPVAELEALGTVDHYADIGAVAAGLGLPEPALRVAFEDYADLAEAGEDLDFGKPSFLLRPFSEGIVAFEVRPAVAKCYGGARLDLQGRVLDTQGDPLPGLYAAGEVAGMLGSPAIGRGFSGTISAVYWTGLLAGEHAAESSLAGQ